MSSDKPYRLPIMISAFLLMYIFQGLYFGYIQSIQLLLKEKGFSYAQMSLLKFTSMPFYLKCFLSPVLDIYYSKTLGKRMTYISIFSVFTALCYLFLASNIDEWILEKQISILAFTLIATMAVIAIQDLAIDALAEEVFIRGDVKYGPITQSIGQIIGPLISFNLFLYLNQSIPELNIKFLYTLAAFTLLSTSFVFFYIKEHYIPNDFTSVFEVIKVFPKFIKNRNIWTFMKFTILSELPLTFFSTVNQLILIDKGMPKEDIASLAIPSLISALVFSFLAGKLNLNIASSFKIMQKVYIYTFVMGTLTFVVINYMDIYIPYRIVYKIFFVFSILDGISFVKFVVDSNFANLICDNTISCTFLALKASFTNFSKQAITPLFTLSLGFFNYSIMAVFFLVYQLAFILVAYPKFVQFFADKKKDDFKVTPPSKTKLE